MAQEWHRAIYAGVGLPEPYYAGEVRDSDAQFPELYGYEVRVGGALGVSSQEVPGELARLEARIQEVCSRLDSAIPGGAPPPDDATLRAVVAACANVHGEWARIHPFANGNGRFARCPLTSLLYPLHSFIRFTGGDQMSKPQKNPTERRLWLPMDERQLHVNST